MDVIDVVPHVRDRFTAMSLLRSTSAPFKAHCSRPLLDGSGYRFTITDVEEFISSRRADLAELVIEGTSDVNMLYDVSRMKVPVPILKAVCRNRHTPAELLLFLFCDSRKGVTSAAKSALAGHMSVVARYADDMIMQLRELVYCPDEELAGRLAAVFRTWPSRALNYAIAAVFERPTPFTDEAWAQIVGANWSWVGNFATAKVAGLVAEHPRTSVEDLEVILGRVRFRGQRSVVQKALLNKLESGSARWLEVLSRDDSTGFASKLGVTEQAKLLTPVQAREFLRRTGVPALIAAESGQLSDDDIALWAREWGQAVEPSYGPVPVSLLSSSAVAGKTLEVCLNRADGASAALQHLALNPGLTVDMQMRMVDDGPARPFLARNPMLMREVAEAVMRVVLDPAPGGAAHSGYVPWRAQGPLMALLANGGLDDDVRLGIPAVAVRSPRYDVSDVLAPAIAFLDGKLGYDAEAWRSFLGLLPEWEGSVGDLVRVVTVL